MQRATTIILGILLGALAAGLGIGIFLKKANDDRERLALEVEKTVQQATEARAENTKAIQDANAKLQAANVEVAKAQGLIKALQEERDLIANATVLPEPSAKTVRGWSDTINVDMGISIKLPATAKVDTNNAREMAISNTKGDSNDARWISITKYNETRDTELLASFTSSTAISYLADGRLLTGNSGTITGSSDTMYVLRAQQSGSSTHMIWIRLPDAKDTDIDTALTILAGLHFGQ